MTPSFLFIEKQTKLLIDPKRIGLPLKTRERKRVRSCIFCEFLAGLLVLQILWLCNFFGVEVTLSCWLASSTFPNLFCSAAADCQMALSTQRDSAFLPSPNHDVFLSFRGEDTRLSFVSHLYHELQLRGIKTFKDDPKLERGTPISSELFKAIEESRLAIVVLSPNYASSSWCLDELTEILQCMKSKGTILPLFYNVDPSHVRKQSGSFADAFAEHEKRFREDIDKVNRWRDALTEVANLAGIDSKNECERKLIEKIVEWVWSKMRRTFKLLDSTEVVGIKFTLEQIDLLLAPTDDVRFIGIWGMGGIGKTTIAKLVYERISINFEVSCFLANVREVSEHGNLVNLQRQLLFPILKEQVTQVWDEQWGTYYIKNCLCNKKVLLILDDVNKSSQLEKIAGKKDWFGNGSIIIITTRDERLLVDMQVLYKVEGLGDDDALELFSRNAFNKNEPEEGFLELSKGFVNYARGLPLALKLLGCLVYKRDQDEWKSELDKLRKIPLSEIFDLLKLSYDGLDEMNQNIFLDVAFFHNRKGKEKVIEILDNCGLCGRIGINALVQKSLLTISNRNVVEMHDLIQEMALEIVRRECPEEPGRRSRLCNYDDISHVFINNTATDKIIGISLRMATLVEKASWNCEAFSKMLNLKYLEFDNVMISSSTRILPNSLRSIKWSSYPSKFLPSDFQPNFLIALEMRESKLVRLWDGRKDLPNLKKMNLSFSENLTTTPDLSGIPNLEVLYFGSCKNLVEIHPSIADLKCLKSLGLGCCSKLKKIPEFSGQMKNLSYLGLQRTSIEKLPSSIGCLVGLTSLCLDDCKNLAGLPSEICNLKSLEELDAEGCSKIDKLPENMGEMESLEWLKLDGTSIRQLPRSVVGLKKLYSLDLGRSGSQPNKSRFWWGLSGLFQNKNGFVLSWLDGLLYLRYLNLSNWGLCEGDLPSHIGCLSSLVQLKLSGNNFVSLPASIGCLSKLQKLIVKRCQRLEQLPDLSKLISLGNINIAGCTSLKMLPHLSSLVDINRVMHFARFDCANCFVLVDNEGCDSIILKMLQRYLQPQLQIQLQLQIKLQLQLKRPIPRPYVQYEFEIVTPGREIPEWFSNQSLGDSLTVELPLDSCTTWIGIALCAVFEVQAHLSEFHYFRIRCSLQGSSSRSFKIGDAVSDQAHLWVIYVSRKQLQKICGQIEVLFSTYDYHQDGIISGFQEKSYASVKKCGFRLVHEQDVEQLNQIMMNQSIIKSTTTCPTNSADAQGQQRLSGLYRNRNGFVLSWLDGLLYLRYLNLSNWGLCEGDLPSDIGCLSSLVQLKLSGNNFVSLPASIGCLSKLQVLKVKRCQSLEQLPDLSKLISLVDINIAGCTSLKMLPHLSSNCSLVDINIKLRFRFNCTNCFVLVDNEGCDSIILKMLQRYLQLQHQRYLQIQLQLQMEQLDIVTPGREIPEWFSNQSLGDSLTVELPLDSCTTWMGIALCAVFEVQAHLSEVQLFVITCSLQGMQPSEFTKYVQKGDVVSPHLWVIYVPREKIETKCSQIKILLTTAYNGYYDRIRWTYESSTCEMKFGFRLVHEQDVEQLKQIMMNKSIIKSTTTCPTKSADAQGQQRDDEEEAGPSGSGSSHQKSLFCNTYALSEEADQDELNDVVDEARPRKRKKMDVFGQEASQQLHFNSM
ncbi:hypothetical protein CerSpe_270910 [Prunus speciosa]